MSCKRTQGFLAQHDATVTETVDAKKQTIPGRQALAVLEGIDQLYVTKGRKVLHFDLKRDQPSRADLAAVLIGPSGNLRAPTVRRGRTLLVGFDQETYEKFVK
ncbi:MAG: ArsC family (seleno)protein [Gemmatimonadales bacterium]